MSEKQQLAKTTAHWYKECEQLQEKVSLLEMKLSFERDFRKGQEDLVARIRELEQKLKDCQQTIFHLQRDQERIAKAREILEEGRKHVLATVKYTDWGSFVRNALDALEGK